MKEGGGGGGVGEIEGLGTVSDVYAIKLYLIVFVFYTEHQHNNNNNYRHHITTTRIFSVEPYSPSSIAATCQRGRESC